MSFSPCLDPCASLFLAHFGVVDAEEHNFLLLAEHDVLTKRDTDVDHHGPIHQLKCVDGNGPMPRMGVMGQVGEGGRRVQDSKASMALQLGGRMTMEQGVCDVSRPEERTRQLPSTGGLNAARGSNGGIRQSGRGNAGQHAQTKTSVLDWGKHSILHAVCWENKSRPRPFAASHCSSVQKRG